MNIKIFPPEEMLEATVTLPLSKSMSARALVINKLQGSSPEIELSDSDDTRALREALNVTQGTVNVGPAGTAMRFLTAYYVATPGADVILDGNERMRQRPMAALIEPLRMLGGDIECLGVEGYAPLKIKGRQLSGGEVRVDSTISSQFLSALMMVAPEMESPLVIKFDGDPVSMSYIKMTASMMTQVGVCPEFSYGQIEIPNTPYTRPIEKIERDWSAASYWYSIAALSAGWVTLCDITMDSTQGDAAMKNIGEKLGVITGESDEVEGAIELSASPEQYSRLDLDMTNTPDLVQGVAFAAAMLGIPFQFTGVKTLRVKETDRLEALKNEALKLGIIFNIENDDTISWDGKTVPVDELPEFETYGDHRMAMALAPVALYAPGIVIKDAEVVSKSYPAFWNDLQSAGFTIVDADSESRHTEENA